MNNNADKYVNNYVDNVNNIVNEVNEEGNRFSKNQMKNVFGVPVMKSKLVNCLLLLN